MSENTQVKLASRPEGLPEDSNWNIETNPIPAIQDGEMLLRTIYVSLDPAMRGWLRDVRSYIPPVQIGEVMRAGAISQVAESKHPDFQVGDYVSGWTGVQQYVRHNGKDIYKVDPKLAPLPKYLGVLGMPGFTAYFGFLNVGLPKEGETVLISGAAGAVGSVVGQIAKIKGCRVVGIAGGEEKCRHIVEDLGFDAAIDYKNDDMRAKLKEHCPKGIDIYFDNVGGEILDLALTRINKYARIPICGAISGYNSTEAPKGPSNFLSILVNSARMEGFIVMNYTKDYGKAAQEMAGWMMQGKLKSEETVVEGIEKFNETFLRLFSGDKRGKLILKVGEE